MSDLIERAERAIILRLPPPVHELIARIRELEAERDARVAIRRRLYTCMEWKERAEKAEAERDQWKARYLSSLTGEP